MNLGMITIYGVHRSRASRNIWLAHELGILQAGPVMQRHRLKDPIPADIVHTRSPSFLKVNPNGHVPTMEDDGLVQGTNRWPSISTSPRSTAVRWRRPTSPRTG